MVLNKSSLKYCISYSSISVNGNFYVIVSLGQIHWCLSWLFFLTPQKHARKSCWFYLPNTSRIHPVVPTHLSCLGSCSILSFLDYYNSSPNGSALHPGVCAPYCSHRDPINTEIRPHPLLRIPCKSFIPLTFKTEDFTATCKALDFFCSLFPLLYPSSFISKSLWV